MINLNLVVRRADAQDHRQISNLIFQELNTHRHLDWRSAVEWIGEQNFWVLEEQGMIVAALACPEDPPDVAWIRLFSHQARLYGPDIWSALWEVAQSEIFRLNTRAQVAAIVMKQWFQNLLLASGFRLRQSIVLLELRGERYLPSPRLPDGVHIRPMQESDLSLVETLDRNAFGYFWHNAYDALHRAKAQSIYSSVAEDETGIIGYQISTGNPFGAHLARLGVLPEAQGRGVATMLVHDLLEQTGIFSSGRLSVNTQSDNIASLSLYQKLGFERTGESYPVFVFPGDAGDDNAR